MTEYYFVKNKNTLFHSFRAVREEFDTTHGSMVSVPFAPEMS